MTATPTSPWTIVAGESLGRYLVAILQAAYIVVVTAVAFNVSWGDPRRGRALIIVLFCLVAAGAAMLVGAQSRNADQAASLGVFVGLALGALGGCMIPFADHAAGDAVDRAPHPALLGGARAPGPDPDRRRDRRRWLPNLAVLLGFAVVLMALAAWRFRKAITG